MSRITTIFILLAIRIIHINASNLDDQCDCGYTDVIAMTEVGDGGPMHQVWTDMWHLDFEKQTTDYEVKDLFVANYNISAKYNGTQSRSFGIQNVFLNRTASEGGLTLAVTVENTTMQCGGFGTQRRDILYGSFRSYIKATPVYGTVGAMYIFNPEEEIDIELLSSLQPSQAYFAIHPGLLENGHASPLTHTNHDLDFDPSAGFHEYRFDWLPGLTIFYIDGIEVRRLVTNIPTLPSRFMFSHWSDGNPKFSQGPPTENAYMSIMNITAFFNYSIADSTSGFTTTGSPRCQEKQEPCSVRSIMANLGAPVNNDTAQSLQPTTTTTNTTDLPYPPVQLSSTAAVGHVYLHTPIFLVMVMLLMPYFASRGFFA